MGGGRAALRLAALLVVSCGALAAGCAARGSGTTAGWAGGGSLIVVQGSGLSGRLLDALRTRVPTMAVTERSGECPQIVFRGQRSAAAQGNPSVYVDGTLMRDTCILTQIPSLDVDSVEIYPSGVTTRAGVGQNPFGLILVFRLRG